MQSGRLGMTLFAFQRGIERPSVRNLVGYSDRVNAVKSVFIFKNIYLFFLFLEIRILTY